MRVIRYWLVTIFWLFIGYVVGTTVGRYMLLPLAGVDRTNVGLTNGLTIFVGVVGAILAMGALVRRNESGSSWGVHGSARWANAAEVKALVR